MSLSCPLIIEIHMKYLNIRKALAAWRNLQPLSEKDRERLCRRFTYRQSPDPLPDIIGFTEGRLQGIAIYPEFAILTLGLKIYLPISFLLQC